MFGLAAASGAARAGIILPAPAVSGPGGTGTAAVDPTNSNILLVEKTYTKLDYLDVTFTVDSGDVYGLFELVGNATGITWTGFRYDIISAPAGSGFFIAADTSGRFADAVANNGPPVTSFSFTAGSVTDGDGFAPIVGMFITDAGEVTVRQTPLTAVPGPSVVVMGLAGAAGCGGLAWRRSRRNLGRVTG